MVRLRAQGALRDAGSVSGLGAGPCAARRGRARCGIDHVRCVIMSEGSGRSHDRFDQLAVGHVLGGLEAADAALFRSHLIACRACRSRVAELRSIAADLDAAEREEREATAVRTAVGAGAGEEAEVAPAPPPSRLTIRHVTALVVVVAVLGTLMAFWNLHLRTVADGYRQAATERAAILRELASGVSVPVELAEGLMATVVVDGDDVAFTLAGVPELDPGDVLVVWLVDAGAQPRSVLMAPAAAVDEGGIAGLTDDSGAVELIVTVERGQPGDEPLGVELLRATLRLQIEGGS